MEHRRVSCRYMRWRPTGISALQLGFLLVLLAFIGGPASAEGLGLTDQRLAGERPDASGPPTPIRFGMYLADVDAIDDVRQRFTVDLFVNITWQDPRLELPENERSGQSRAMPLDEIWTPRGLIVNDRGLSQQLPLVAQVDDLGNVTYRQRLSGELAANFHFKEFPFDTQRLPIEIVSYQYSPDDIRFVLSEALAGVAGSFSVEGWRLRMLEPELGEFTIPAAGLVRPRLTYVIEAQRVSRYYLLTMFLPMVLIVFMAWTAFWLQPSIVPSRIAISTASIFSLIALGISIRLRLPPVSYMTRADLFVIGCTVLVFLALGVAVIGSRWASADKIALALKLNAAMRWVYVGLFGVVVLVVMMI